MFRVIFLFFFLCFTISSAESGQSCDWTAPDWTGRSYAHDSYCTTNKSGSSTEIWSGRGNEIWQVIGNVVRKIEPGFVWNGSSWFRDTNQDRVLWEGTAKQSVSSCRDKKATNNSWDFSNGTRICLY